MKISVLVENTSKCCDLLAEHGLSFYIEANGKKILFDMGQTEMFSENAEKMEINCSDVDFAVLSHGHYDHGGGLSRFFEINQKTMVYVSDKAFGDYYRNTERYIGLDKELKKTARFIESKEKEVLAEGITLYNSQSRLLKYPIQSFGLIKKENEQFLDDDFLHEQYLMIEEDGKKILISGCSHRGILNIMHWFKPDVLIGGFHFSKLDPETLEGEKELKKAAEELMSYPTVYYTCHCTGEKQYLFMKNLMQDQLHYCSAGDVIEI